MKTINFEFKVSEAVDGYRVDLNDWTTGTLVKLNPETKDEVFRILRSELLKYEGMRVI